MPEKDSFGDKLRDKEHGEEDQYFAGRDRDLLQKMRARSESADETRAREIGQGRCPKCGEPLEKGRVDDVVLEECASCSGVWLGREEIAKLSQRESDSFVGRLFRRILARSPQ